jgi:hypothetical protein
MLQSRIAVIAATPANGMAQHLRKNNKNKR